MSAHPDDPSDCVDLTNFDERDLARYRIEARHETERWAALEPRRTYTTGRVRIVIQPVFDPDDPHENNVLYRWADRLHADTRPSVIREAILFRTDEPVTLSEMRESERILRAKPYLYDARVLPRRLCGERLDIDVVARDVWTLLPEADFARSGGDNSYGYGLTDTNLIGTGHTLSLFYEKDPDRDGTGVYYLDPNLRGSRVMLETLLENNSDGSRRLLALGQPFYSLDARRAWGLRGEEIDLEQGLYRFGDKFAEFAQDYRSVGVLAGVSSGEHNGRTWRWLAGFDYEKRTFSPVQGEIPPNPLPQDRTLAYPWLGVASVEDRFLTSTDVDLIHRTEDLDLGRAYEAKLGYSSSAFGGVHDRLVFRGAYTDGVRREHHDLLFVRASLDGYWNFDSNRSEGVYAKAYAAYRQQQAGHFGFAATAEGVVAHNLFGDQQLLGGGDTGLRGYPSRYQWGNRSYLLTFEERYFSDLYIARIVRVGVAVFVDVGRTWFSGADGDGYGTLADAGVGFRFESTRTRQDRVLHVDFAFPLVDGPDVQSMQILLVVKQRL